jgi:predicted dinucleotide-binding enzyme
MKIAIIGAGNVGGALARAWVRAGHDVIVGARDGSKGEPIAGVRRATITEAIQASEVVALTVPWAAALEVVSSVADWGGKVLIDCTNPIGQGFELTAGFSTSGGEQVAAQARNARVVKAFNTTGFGNMENPVYEGKVTFMPFCGDDEAACATVRQLVQDVGFDPVFVGPLKVARYLEPFAMLWITIAMKQGRDFAFALLRP